MAKNPKIKPTEMEFTAAERAYIRRELDQVLSSWPNVADGFLLKVWKTGSKAGQPKLSPPAESLVGRGMMEVKQGATWPTLSFTLTGLDALRRMMADAKLANPVIFAHVRKELGL